MAARNRDFMPDIEQALDIAQQNGWTNLVAAIRRILNGERNLPLALHLDDEDSIIIEAILLGIQNPETLPKSEQQADPIFAAPGLAGIIYQASLGNAESLQVLATLSEQMITVGGDMGRLGGMMRRLLNGERDPDKLCKGMSAQGRTLVISILEELGKRQAH